MDLIWFQWPVSQLRAIIAEVSSRFLAKAGTGVAGAPPFESPNEVGAPSFAHFAKGGNQ